MELIVTQRVVCAAIRIQDVIGLPTIIIGPRHYDAVMHEAIETHVYCYGSHYHYDLKERWSQAEQGFIDQWGNFLTRTEAWLIAFTAGQILRFVGNQNPRELMAQELFSENLY